MLYAFKTHFRKSRVVYLFKCYAIKIEKICKKLLPVVIKCYCLRAFRCATDNKYHVAILIDKGSFLYACTKNI